MTENPKRHPPVQLDEGSRLRGNSCASASLSTVFKQPLRIQSRQFENKNQVIEFFENAFRDQRNIFEAIVDNTSAVIYVKDPEGKYLMVNRSFEKLFHVKRREIQGKTDFDFFPYKMAEAFRKNDEKVLKAAAAIEFEEIAPHDDGPHTYVSLKFPILDSQNQICAVAGISTDISHRKSFEAALQSSSQYLGKIINTVADPIFVKDREHRWVLLNDAMCRFFGYPREQLIGKSDYDYFPKSQADVFWKKDEEVFLTGKENLNEEYFTDAQGVLHTIVTKKTLYTDPEGAHFIVGVIRDVTEQKRAEQDLVQKNLELAKANAEREYLELFACVASHDLQEPLQKIIAFGGLLKTHSSSDLDEKGKGFIDKLQFAATRMSRMIEDLLQFTKVTTGTETFEQVDLEVVLGEVLSDLDEKITQLKAKIQVGNLPLIYAQRRQMYLLFLNLVGNALKFHKKNVTPKIKIKSSSPEPGYLKIEVEDNGIGFDERYLERMFRPFERFHAREEYEGNGIGLAICKKIVMHHSGTLTARSSAHGSIFTVTLPGVSNK